MDKNFQMGWGVGSLLLISGAWVGCARTFPRHGIWLTVRRKEYAAIALFLEVGFKIVGLSVKKNGKGRKKAMRGRKSEQSTRRLRAKRSDWCSNGLRHVVRNAVE